MGGMASEVLEMRMVEARDMGRDTAIARKPRVNPWKFDAELASERVLSIMWARGFSEGNPVDLDAADADDDGAPTTRD